MNRKIALSLLSIVGALTIMGGSAFAAFTTTATATANTFSTTTPNLTVNVNGTGDGTTEPGATVTGLVPGTPGATQTFVLTNHDTDLTGDLATTLQFNVSGSNTLPGGDLTITVNCGAGNITDTYSGWISTGHALGTVPHSSFLTCTMIPTLNSGVGNSDINKSAIFDAVFTGSVGT